MLRLRDLLVEWASTLEPELTRTFRWPLGWLVGAFAVAALLATVAWVPPPRGLVGLALGPVLVLQLLALGAAWAVAEFDVRGRLTPPARGLAILAEAFLFQLFASSLVVFSEPPGSYLLASAPMVALSLHGLLIRPTIRAPLPLVAHAVGMAAAFALRPGWERGVILFLAFALGSAGSLAVGTLAAGAARRRTSLAGHRTAIEAQVLEAQALEHDRVAGTLSELEERAREGRALVAIGLRALDGLREAPATWRDASARSEASGLAGSLRVALERIEHALTSAGAPEVAGGPPAVGELEAVDVGRIAREVRAEMARRFPDVALTGPPPGVDAPRALLSGGEESLRRILESLVENACEGEGLRGARAVDVSIRTPVDASGIDVVVRDDGPGFRPELLASAVRAFATTKPHGTGLGLYTAVRLVTASGGVLLRENLAGNGAAVTLRLRTTPTPSRGAAG